VITCFGLGWCGAVNPDDYVLGTPMTFLILGQILTAYYFAYFLVVLPVLGFIEKPKERPVSIEASVLGKQPTAAPAE
jgi:ubiquinol-cytochrome c reductase cytochrome b subunit